MTWCKVNVCMPGQYPLCGCVHGLCALCAFAFMVWVGTRTSGRAVHGCNNGSVVLCWVCGRECGGVSVGQGWVSVVVCVGGGGAWANGGQKRKTQYIF